MTKGSSARVARGRFSPTRFITAVALLFLGLAACLLGFRVVRADISAEAYKRQATTLVSSYNSLRETYNSAVRRSAVTELVVEDGGLSVHVRGMDGVLKRLETPFDPDREIFVDYVVIDQRLWIRRVFDSETPPSKGLLIEPSLGEVDWNDERANHGKTVYRSLGEGRWIIDITRDGSLGLRRAREGELTQLVPAPELVEHEPVEEAIRESLRTMTIGDIWRALVGGS